MENLGDLEKIRMGYVEPEEVKQELSQAAKLFQEFADYLSRIIGLMVSAEEAFGDGQGSEKLAKFKKDWEEFLKSMEANGRKIPAWCEDFRNIQRIINFVLIAFKLATAVLPPQKAVSALMKTISNSLTGKIK